MEELIAKYLSEEMSEAERSDFENKLLSDEELSNALQSSLALWVSTETNNSGTFNANKAWTNVSESISDQKVISIRRSKNFSILKIAATLLIVLAAGFFITRSISYTDSVAEPIVLSANNAFQEFTLPDGSIVKLNANSRISYNDGFGSEHRSLRLEGAANFDVVRNENIPFTIKTDNSVTQVLGTSFDLNAYNSSDVELNVTSGKVMFKSLVADQEAIVDAGNRARLIEDGNKIELSKLVNNNYSAWWTRKLQFDQAPLSEVAKYLEKTYAVNIDLAQNLMSCTLTATYNDVTLDDALELIKATFASSEIQIVKEKENFIKLEGKACTD